MDNGGPSRYNPSLYKDFLPNKDHNGLYFAILYAKGEGVKIPHIKKEKEGKGGSPSRYEEGRRASERAGMWVTMLWANYPRCAAVSAHPSERRRRR